jgi:hypothetical protein
MYDSVRCDGMEGGVRYSPNSSARPMVHRKTPPKETSSPNTTAVSSLSNAVLSSQRNVRHFPHKHTIIADPPHSIPHGLINVHLSRLPSGRRANSFLLILVPDNTWRAKGCFARCAHVLGRGYRRAMASRWWGLDGGLGRGCLRGKCSKQAALQ